MSSSKSDAARSVIYSRRALELGGGLVKSSADYNDWRGQTTRHVNSTIDGMSYGYAPIWPNYFGITTRYSQTIYNTDIILRTPQGTATPRLSRIFDANLPTDGVYGVNDRFSDATNKKFSPTVKIIGGDIYVGAGQQLTIDGGRFNYASGEATQVVSPDSITVAKGGTLVIRGRVDEQGNFIAPSDYANVSTNIFVEGTLNLQAGAQLSGIVRCYGSGVINVNATIGWQGTDTSGILVYDGGTIKNSNNYKVSLSSGSQRGTGVVHFLELSSSVKNISGYICDNTSDEHLCRHYGELLESVYIPGAGFYEGR